VHNIAERRSRPGESHLVFQQAQLREVGLLSIPDSYWRLVRKAPRNDRCGFELVKVFVDPLERLPCRIERQAAKTSKLLPVAP